MEIKNKILNQIGTFNLVNWKPASLEKYNWAESFKDIFILQKKENISLIFNEEKFGLHNGFTLKEYCDYEFKEFELKSKNFGLILDCSIQCFDIGEDYFYLCLGKKTEKALFESIFKWDDKSKKVMGNGYTFKIEPKTQFIIFQNSQENSSKINEEANIHKNIIIKRRINFSPTQPDHKIKTVLLDSDANNFDFIKNECEPHLGGTFYSLIFQLDKEHCHTYWDNVTIYSNLSSKKTIKAPVFMRGIDHPLFLDNLFPIVTLRTVKCPKITDNLFLLYVKLKNGEEFFYKYPKETFWIFDSDIEQVSITDTLSFDWIVCLK